jgi:hypothetical protein
VTVPAREEPNIDDRAPIDPEHVLVVRRGPGANCSSIGSVLDLLFISALAGGAVLVAVTAALGKARDDDAGEGGGRAD